MPAKAEGAPRTLKQQERLSPQNKPDTPLSHGEDDEDEADLDWNSQARKAALQAAEEAKRERVPRLGLDFGNVIIAHDEAGGWGFTKRGSDGAVQHCVQCCAGAREGVRALVKLFKRENVFIVSKAGRRVAARTQEWLLESGFISDTGLVGSDAHIYFVNGRMEKRPIVEMLGITHFVDDRMSVLRSLQSCCAQRVLMAAPWVKHEDRHDRGDKKYAQSRVVVQSWPEAVGQVRKWFKTHRGVDAQKQALQGLSFTASRAPPTPVSTPAKALPILQGSLAQTAQVAPPAPPENQALAERQAWLEYENSQLRAQAAQLFEGLAQRESAAQRATLDLRARDDEGLALLLRISALEQQLAGRSAVTPQSAPPWDPGQGSLTAMPPVPASPGAALAPCWSAPPTPSAAAVPPSPAARAPGTPMWSPPLYPAPPPTPAGGANHPLPVYADATRVADSLAQALGGLATPMAPAEAAPVTAPR